jgi:hypothetical protein
LSLTQIEAYRRNTQSTTTTTSTSSDSAIIITSESISNCIDLLEKVITIIDSQLSNITIVTSYASNNSITSMSSSAASTINPSIIINEVILFEVCLLRLANLSSSLSLHLYHINNGQNGMLLFSLHQRFNTICRLFHYPYHNQQQRQHHESYSNSMYNPILDESLQLFKTLIPADTSFLYHQSFFQWFIHVVEYRSKHCIDSISTIVEAMKPFVKKFSKLAYEVR